MKRVFSGILLPLIFCIVLTACSVPKDDKTDPTVQKPQPPDTIKEGDVINPEDSDAGAPFRVDDTFLDELPTQGISVYDAQKIIVETLHPEATVTVPEGCGIIYVYSGLIDLDGVQCYRIEFGIDNDVEVTVERTFAVSLAGELYEGVPNTDAYAPYELFAAHTDVKGDDMEPVSEEEAMRRIQEAMNLLGDTSTVIRREGDETIDNEHCMTFSAGNNSADGQKYTAISHYAVSDSGVLWYMDVVEGPEWLLFDDSID